MNHEHAFCENDFCESHSESKSADRTSIDPPPVKFSKIDPDHVKRIARQHDVGLFQAYFADALRAKFAKDTDADRIRMAGLFHQVDRIGEARVPGQVIHKRWKNRDEPGDKGLRLARVDEEFGRLLLRPRASPDRRMIISPLRIPDDGQLTPEQIREQRQRAESNLQALATMQRLTVPT